MNKGVLLYASILLYMLFGWMNLLQQCLGSCLLISYLHNVEEESFLDAISYLGLTLVFFITLSKMTDSNTF